MNILVNYQEIGKLVNETEKDSIYGKQVNDILVNGKMIKCMDKEHLLKRTKNTMSGLIKEFSRKRS